jgi:hypothetical protein
MPGLTCDRAGPQRRCPASPIGANGQRESTGPLAGREQTEIDLRLYQSDLQELQRALDKCKSSEVKKVMKSLWICDTSRWFDPNIFSPIVGNDLSDLLSNRKRASSEPNSSHPQPNSGQPLKKHKRRGGVIAARRTKTSKGPIPS